MRDVPPSGLDAGTVPTWVGVDVGGTAIKAGAITPAGDVIREATCPTPVDSGAPAIFEALADLVGQVSAGQEISTLGVGMAAGLEPGTGQIITSPNMTCLVGQHVPEALGAVLGFAPEEARKRIRVLNDANAAALGEQWLGIARGEDNVVVLTLGTGIGGGLILDGSLVKGATGSAAEIGHVIVDPSGPLCGCGARGCLEAMASARAASGRARAAGLPAADPGNLPALCENARAAPGPERDLLLDVGRDLGRGLTAALALLDLDLFVFSGGFANALDILEPGIRLGLDRGSTPQGRRRVRLVRAALGNRAGWIGAARLAGGA